MTEKTNDSNPVNDTGSGEKNNVSDKIEEMNNPETLKKIDSDQGEQKTTDNKHEKAVTEKKTPKEIGKSSGTEEKSNMFIITTTAI